MSKEDENFPEKVYVKMDRGFVGRAYTEDQMNFTSTPPEGVEYIPYIRADDKILKCAEMLTEAVAKAYRIPKEMLEGGDGSRTGAKEILGE